MRPTTTRRRFLATAVGVASAGLAGCESPTRRTATATTTTTGGAEPTTSTTTAPAGTTGVPPDAVGLETVASGFEAPLDVAFHPEADRRYVATQPGRVFVHESGGVRDDPFLDLRDVVEFGGERGLLGLALHPAFAENRRLYVRYSAPPRPGTPDGYSHTFVLSEFETDGRRVDRATERTVLEIPEPQSNHNSGAIAFGPDGYLYVGVGDGGAGGDQGPGHADTWYEEVTASNGQNVTDNLLGSLLRIDVDDRDGDRSYGVPTDNPLVGRAGLDEHYAWGLRNPWRFSFDGEDLFVGDVGQQSYEEVNLVEKGGNYGWNVREGAGCFRADTCPDRTPPSVRGGERLRPPIVEYPHEGDGVAGPSVIGGYVYRGSALPAMRGVYLFGDLLARGRLFAATRPESGVQWPVREVPVRGVEGPRQLLSFGRDHDGEVYVLADGGLHRVVPTN